MRSCDVPMRFIVVSEDYSFDDDKAEPLIKVEVAYATPERQFIVPLNEPAGTAGLEAVRQSNITFEFSEINIDKDPMGAFSKPLDGKGGTVRSGQGI